MSSSSFVRFGGIAAVVAGLVLVVLALLNLLQRSADVAFSLGPLSTILFVVALLGQMAGTAGLHVLQSGRYGWLGVAGSLLTLAGTALQLVAALGSSLAGGASLVGNLVLALLFILGILAPFVGLVLLGVANLRTRALPGWFGVLLIAGLFVVAILVGVQLLVVGVLAYGIFWMLVGYVLLSSGGTRARQSVRAG